MTRTNENRSLVTSDNRGTTRDQQQFLVHCSSETTTLAPVVELQNVAKEGGAMIGLRRRVDSRRTACELREAPLLL